MRSILALHLGHNRQRMNIGDHQVTDCRIHRPVPRKRAHPLKRRADHLYPEVPSPIPRARMTGVQVALILHYQRDRVEGRLDGSADRRHPRLTGQRPGGHGSTLRNGRTSTRVYTPAAT